jgi:hypothetical protein
MMEMIMKLKKMDLLLLILNLHPQEMTQPRVGRIRSLPQSRMELMQEI